MDLDGLIANIMKTDMDDYGDNHEEDNDKEEMLAFAASAAAAAKGYKSQGKGKRNDGRYGPQWPGKQQYWNQWQGYGKGAKGAPTGGEKASNVKGHGGKHF